MAANVLVIQFRQQNIQQLLLGKEAMERLSNAKVAVFGIGGVGGYVVEALARTGIGAFVLVDDDKICLTNLNRQIIATRSSVGKYHLGRNSYFLGRITCA